VAKRGMSSLTTERDGSVLDCYGFVAWAPPHPPLWTGPRSFHVARNG
jgi:hypothetical protein